jgi:hypothetical protein
MEYDSAPKFISIELSEWESIKNKNLLLHAQIDLATWTLKNIEALGCAEWSGKMAKEALGAIGILRDIK